jgi:hypothetical protein
MGDDRISNRGMNTKFSRQPLARRGIEKYLEARSSRSLRPSFVTLAATSSSISVSHVLEL